LHEERDVRPDPIEQRRELRDPERIARHRVHDDPARIRRLGAVDREPEDSMVALQGLCQAGRHAREAFAACGLADDQDPLRTASHVARGSVAAAAAPLCREAPAGGEHRQTVRITQVATTYGRSCGIGTFARSLEVALRDAGVRVRTVTGVGAGIPPADITLVQHEWGIFADDEVRAVARASPQPVVFFAHSPGGVERFNDIASAFVAMAPGVVGVTERPVFVLPHPARVPERLTDRSTLRARYGIEQGTYTLGSSGFLRRDHEFPEVLARLLPHALAHGWRVELTGSTWLETPPALIEALDALRERYPAAFRYTADYLEWVELNERLQACDLLWCWSATRSAPYASGSISDHYASGTRLAASEIRQYEHIIALPNVVRAPSELDGFVERLVAEAASGNRTRHDPAPISWRNFIQPLAGFLSCIAAAA